MSFMNPEPEGKPVWKSKVLWINIAMLVLDALNGTYGAIPIDPQVKVYILVVVNMVLRFLTFEGIQGAKTS